MEFSTKVIPLVILAFANLSAADLPAETQAKFIKILASSAGSAGKVLCNNAALTTELGKVGVSPDATAKIAWASSEAEVKSLKSSGKLVICGKLEWLSEGGAIAIIEEGGKPQIYLSMRNISASGVTLSDAVLKIGKKL